MSPPAHYPFAYAPTATLLKWGHMAEPPYNEVQKAAPWLDGEGQVRSYLEGVIAGRIHFWRCGPLFGSSGQ